MLLLPPDVKGSNPADMLWGDGFEIETLINLRIAKAGLSVTEVPSFEVDPPFRRKQPQCLL